MLWSLLSRFMNYSIKTTSYWALAEKHNYVSMVEPKETSCVRITQNTLWFMFVLAVVLWLWWRNLPVNEKKQDTRP